MSIKYYGIKIIAIYKYLLSLNIDENHETMPYINSKIIEDFNKYEIEVTQSAYMKDSQKDDNYVDLLFNLIKEYYEFKPYEKQSKLEKLLENNCFIRDCTGAMMIILNSAFFKISNKNINRMMDLIKNNSYLKKIIEDGTMGKQSLDRDYIFQYTSRFLFNAEFINQENIENDLLIKAIKEGIFKDKNTFQQIFKNINIYILLQAFNKNLSLLIDSLEKAFEDDLVKLELFNIVYIKIIEEKEFRIIINFIMHDNRSEKYISVQERKKVINEFSNNYPVEISDEEIEFVLKQENIDLFLINLKNDYKNNKWNEKTRYLVRKATENIQEYDFDFHTSMKVLDSFFKGAMEINILMLLECFKVIIKNYLQSEDIKVYIITDNSINGCTFVEDNCIMLNYDLIKQMLNTRNYEEAPESIHILETIFHEARHIQQFLSMKNENMDDDIYKQYKEDILVCISSQYYRKNYVGISFERDARISGSQMVVNLLKQYFPYMNKSISYYSKRVKNENNSEVENKIIFELSETLTIDEALEKLLSINPSLIEQFSVLKREYNLDGSKKNIDQIDSKIR